MTGAGLLSELDAVARRAAITHRSRLLGYDARAEAAFDGAVDAWLLGEDPYLGGLRAISRAVDAEQHHHGLGTKGREHARQYHVYWRTPVAEHWADRLVDQIAVREIWRLLPGPHQLTLRQLVEADGDISLAAGIAGVSYTIYRDRLATARRWARQLWFDWERPPGHWRKSYGRPSSLARALRVAVAARRLRRRRKAS